METYIINGKEFQYDTFDLDAMGLFDSEVQRVAEAARGIGTLDAASYLPALREQCENVLDFFDAVLGDGAARELFGDRINVKVITEAYRQFTSDVTAARAGLTAGMAPSSAPINRAQRRAMQRAVSKGAK